MALSLLKRRTALALAMVAASALALGTAAQAQEFPDRTITLVVPFAAGGSTDVVSRIIGQKMSEDLGQETSWKTSPVPVAISAPTVSHGQIRMATPS